MNFLFAMIFKENWEEINSINSIYDRTRLSVNYAKDWLDQLFLFPGLVWKTLFFTLNVVTGGAIQSHFHVNEAIFGMVTNKQPNIQLDDPSASLLLTSEKAVFCKKSQNMCSPANAHCTVLWLPHPSNWMIFYSSIFLNILTIFSLHWLLGNNKCHQYFHFSQSASSLWSLNCEWNKCKQWAKFECRGPRILFVKLWNSPAIVGQNSWGHLDHLANLIISLKTVFSLLIASPDNNNCHQYFHFSQSASSLCSLNCLWVK